MAALKFTVSSYSSQDAKYPASNLQKSSTGWLCSAMDMKRGRAEVTIRLDQRSALAHIDIGNNGSFSIEIQVARSGDENFYNLISATTFMSANDSRSATNKNAVRMFKTENFDETNRRETWDRMRIICTQPFRKDKPFGVSMLKLRAETDFDIDNNNSSPSRSKLDRLAAQDKDDSTSPSSNSSSSKENWFKGAMQGRLNQIMKSGQTSQNNDRSMRMVMAAVKTPTHKTQLVHELMEKKSSPSSAQPTFMGSIRTFFRGLDLTNIDPYSMKVSELRHQFEKVKCRKLSSDEKKLFKGYALEFFDNRVNGSQKTSQHAEERAPVKKPTAAHLKVMEMAKQLSKGLTNNPNNSPQLKKLPSAASANPELIDMTYDSSGEADILTVTPRKSAAVDSVISPKTPAAGCVVTTPKHDRKAGVGTNGLFVTPQRPSASPGIRAVLTSPNTNVTAQARTPQLTAGTNLVNSPTAHTAQGNKIHNLAITPNKPGPGTVTTPSTNATQNCVPATSPVTTTANTIQGKPTNTAITPKGKHTLPNPPIIQLTNGATVTAWPNGPTRVSDIISQTHENGNITVEDLKKAMLSVNGCRSLRIIKAPAHFKDFVTNGQVIAKRTATQDRPITPKGKMGNVSVVNDSGSLLSKPKDVAAAHKSLPSEPAAFNNTIANVVNPPVNAMTIATVQSTPTEAKQKVSSLTTVTRNGGFVGNGTISNSQGNTPMSTSLTQMAAQKIAGISLSVSQASQRVSTGRTSSTPLKNLPSFTKPSPSLPSPIINTTPLRSATETTPKSFKLLPASQRRSGFSRSPAARRSTAQPATARSTALPVANSQTPKAPTESQSTSSQPRRNINSTAVSPSQHSSTSLRTEIRPNCNNLKKRTIEDLLSDDDDDLMLPPRKKTQTSTATPSFNQSAGGASFTQTPSQSQSQSCLTLQDLLSSSDEEEGDPPPLRPNTAIPSPHMRRDTPPTHITTPARIEPSLFSDHMPHRPHVHGAAIYSGLSAAPDVIVSSDDEDDLPEITLDTSTGHSKSIYTPSSSTPNATYVPHGYKANSQQTNHNAGSYRSSSSDYTNPYFTYKTQNSSNAVQCPICFKYFLSNLIEVHASNCIIE